MEKRFYIPILKAMTKMPLYLYFVRLSSEGLKEDAVAVVAATTKIPQLLDPGSC